MFNIDSITIGNGGTLDLSVTDDVLGTQPICLGIDDIRTQSGDNVPSVVNALVTEALRRIALASFTAEQPQEEVQ